MTTLATTTKRKYLTRRKATAYLNEVRGVPTGEHTLEMLAGKKLGPRYAMINGRALYTEENLDAWVDAQAADKPAAAASQRGRTKSSTPVAPIAPSRKEARRAATA
jgi:hypothetical protein